MSVSYVSRSLQSWVSTTYRSYSQLTFFNIFYEKYFYKTRIVLLTLAASSGGHRPISFIRIKHRTRANDFCKTEYWQSYRRFSSQKTYYTNVSDVPRSLQSRVSTIQTVVLTAYVFQLFIKTTASCCSRPASTASVVSSYTPHHTSLSTGKGTSCGPLVCLCCTRVAMHGRSFPSPRVIVVVLPLPSVLNVFPSVEPTTIIVNVCIQFAGFERNWHFEEIYLLRSIAL